MSEEERIIQILAQALERLGQRVGTVTEKFDDITDPLEKNRRIIKSLTEEFDRVNKNLVKGRKNILDMGQTIKDLGQSLEEMTDNVDDAADAIEKEKQLSELAGQYNRALMAKASKDFAMAIGDVFVKSTIQQTKTLVSGLQSGASSVSIAGNLMADKLDQQQGMIDAVTAAGTTLGAGLITQRGKATAFGGALVLGSQALGYFSNKVTDAAKFGIDMLTKGAEQTINSFRTMTSVGVLFAGGMDDMRYASKQSGLTLEQFANVVKASQQELAAAGYGMAQTTRIVAGISNQLLAKNEKTGITFRQQLINLGVGVEDQAKLIAEMTSGMRRYGFGIATNRELAESSIDVAKNIKMMAGIMGEEANTRREQAKKLGENYAFQQRLLTESQKLPPEKRAAFIQDVYTKLGSLSPPLQRAAMQAELYGGAFTDAALHVAGAGGMIQQSARGLLDANTSVEQFATYQAKFNDQFGTQQNAALAAMAGSNLMTGAFAQETETLNTLFKDAGGFTTEALRRSAEEVNKLADNTSGLQGQFAGLETSVQNFRNALDKEITDNLPKFATAADAILQHVRDQLAKVGGAGNLAGAAAQEVGFFDKYGGDIALALTGISAIVGSGVGAVATGGAATPLALGGAMAGAGMASVGLGNIFNKAVLGKEGFAEGGISEGPKSGYMQKLHGTEAVVPLPDGNSIPVQLAFSPEMNQEIAPGLTPYSGYNIGMITTNLQVVADMAKQLGALSDDMQTITDVNTWKQILPYGMTYDLGTERVGVGELAGRPEYQEIINSLVEEFKAAKERGQEFATPESAIKETPELREMIELMKQQQSTMNSLLRETNRGNNINNDILQSSM